MESTAKVSPATRTSVAAIAESTDPKKETQVTGAGTEAAPSTFTTTSGSPSTTTEIIPLVSLDLH